MASPQVALNTNPEQGKHYIIICAVLPDPRTLQFVLPKPYTPTNSAVFGITGFDEQEGETLLFTFSRKCQDPPTTTACALKSQTLISPVPHISSWKARDCSQSQEPRKQGNSYCANCRCLKCLEKKYFGFFPDPESTRFVRQEGKYRKSCLARQQLPQAHSHQK